MPFAKLLAPKPIARWRRTLVLISIGVLTAMWLFTLVVGAQIEGVAVVEFSWQSPHAAAAWLMLAAATVGLFVAFNGTMPDRFALFIPLAVTLNVLLGAISMRVGAPFCFDTFGTVIASLVGGPLLGAVVACVTALLWGVSNPMVVPLALSTVVVAYYAGLASSLRRLNSLEHVIGYGLISGVVVAFLSTVTVVFALDGSSYEGAELLAMFFRYVGMSAMGALLVQQVLSHIIEEVFSFLAAAAFIRHMPRRVFDVLTYWGNQGRIIMVLRNERELATLMKALKTNEEAVDTESSEAAIERATVMHKTPNPHPRTPHKRR